MRLLKRINHSEVKLNKIYNEDCLKTMARMPSNFVDLVITSPPYDNLRDYDGYSFAFEKIARYLFKVVKEGGIIVWVVGDATIKGSESTTSFRQALYFKQIGFNLHDTMIYAKNNPIPQNHNRYEQQFEYMFIFSKGKVKTFNPLKIESINGGKELEWGNRKSVDKKAGRRGRAQSCVVTTKLTKNMFNIWYFSIGGGHSGHPAVFPYKLAEQHLLSWSNKNDIVYDPFMGSGTTAKACIKNKRNYIGSEISKEYCKIADRSIEEC